MNEQLIERLKNMLVELTIKISAAEEDKRTSNAGYSEVIKDYKKRIKAISNAISKNDESILIHHYGEFYREELGVKK